MDFISEMEMTAEEAFHPFAPKMGRPNEKEIKAKEFLLEILKDGEMLSSDCEERLEAAGFKKSTHHQKGKEESRSYLQKERLSVVLVFADRRYAERINAGCLMGGQSVFMIEVSKGGQGGTPLPTTSLQTKSESVIVGYTHSKNVV